MSESDFEDMSWLTQESNISYQPSFDVGGGFIFGDYESGNQCVSLEDQPSTSKGKVLYDYVEAQDISSDECIDDM